MWGLLVDIIGRQYAFNLTCLRSSVFGLCLGAPSNYNGILVLTAFVGFGVGGNIPIDTTICLEFLPQARCSWINVGEVELNRTEPSFSARTAISVPANRGRNMHWHCVWLHPQILM